MKMKKILIVSALGLFFTTISAQDVIVMKNGSTILSKVIEVNTSDIKYKKHSNINGPTYIIEISEIMSVNYENGEKDTFENKKAKTTSQNTNAVPDSKNDSLIALYNTPVSYYKNKKSNKKANGLTYKYGMSSTSVLSTDELEINIILNGEGSWYNAPYVIKLSNKTEDFIYIDLANCFKIYPNGKPVSYYDAKQTTISSGGGSGASIGLGAVTDAIGIGGVVGTIANGVSVGGGRNSSASTVYSQQRLLIIPPHSTDNLTEYKSEGSGKNYRIITNSEKFNIDKDLVWLNKNDLARYEVLNYKETDSPYKLKFILPYSTNENFTDVKRINFELFVQQVFGVSIELSLSYAYYIPDDWEDQFLNLNKHTIIGATIESYKNSRKVGE